MHTSVVSDLYETLSIPKYVNVIVKKVKSSSPTWENPQQLNEDIT